MTPTVRGSVVTGTKASDGNDLVLTMDAAIVGDELLLFGVAQQAAGITFTTPTGWSLATSDGQGANSTNVGCALALLRRKVSCQTKKRGLLRAFSFDISHSK